MSGASLPSVRESCPKKRHLVSLVSARSSFPFKYSMPVAHRPRQETRRRVVATTPRRARTSGPTFKVQESRRRTMNGEREPNYNRTKKWGTTACERTLQAHGGLTSASRNPQLKMAVGWECLYIGKTCSDLFPRCSNKVRFTIGQQLFRAAIAPKTRGTKRPRAVPSRVPRLVLVARGWERWLSIPSRERKEKIFLLSNFGR